MHYIINSTDLTLYLKKEQWSRSSGLLVNGDFNDPIATTTTTTTTKTTTTTTTTKTTLKTTTSGQNSSFKIITLKLYFINFWFI
jgi:hypothetical protein